MQIDLSHIKLYADKDSEPEQQSATPMQNMENPMITKLKDIVGCDGYNVLQNNGIAAGQTVFHFHMHLIPRYENDEVNIGWKPGTLTDEVKELVVTKMSE